MKLFQPIKNLLNESNILCSPEQRRINSLEVENAALKDTIKDDLYKAFIRNFGSTKEVMRLREENKNLRSRNKELKREIKGGKKT